MAWTRRLASRSGGGEMMWRIEHRSDGYRLFDEKGLERGRYRSANDLATQLAFALRELDAWRHRMATDHFFARLGEERPNAQ